MGFAYSISPLLAWIQTGRLVNFCNEFEFFAAREARSFFGRIGAINFAKGTSKNINPR
jgi:hypothetical protein